MSTYIVIHNRLLDYTKNIYDWFLILKQTNFFITNLQVVVNYRSKYKIDYGVCKLLIEILLFYYLFVLQSINSIPTSFLHIMIVHIELKLLFSYLYIIILLVNWKGHQTAKP